MPLVMNSQGIGRNNVKEVGGKAANLAEMINAGFPVPEAFFITVEAYNEFIDSNDLRGEILSIISNTDMGEVGSIKAASDHIQSTILNAKMSQKLEHRIVKAYKMLPSQYGSVTTAQDFVNVSGETPFVAVRSSSVLEDVAKTSAAGQYETFLNIRGSRNLLDAVKRCWASFYTTRAIYYRHKHGQPQDAGIGVIVQRMIDADRSGITFTVDPTDPQGEGRNHIVTEAAWGLGETIVQGMVEPDRYAVNKLNGEILYKKIGIKGIKRVRDPSTGATTELKVSADKQKSQVLNDTEIIALSAICSKIEKHYSRPQDIEWATEGMKMYILQTRAITTLGVVKGEAVAEGEELVSGYGASPGIASGPVKILHDIREIGKIEKGDVLVTPMTNPDLVPIMEKSAAIITDRGGSTSHAAIVSRELGIPCIVGTKNATTVLKDGQEVTVDASHGKIYAGKIAAGEQPEKETAEGPAGEGRPVEEAEEAGPVAKGRVKVKANIAFPDVAERAASADGVGLLRLEHMLTRAGMHPMEYIREGKTDELMNIIVDGVGKVAGIFKGKPVWVRSLDVRTDEYRSMKGGESEPEEANPMIGWHGIRRSLDEPEILRTEFRAIKKLHEQGMTNVAIMFPFVIDVSEIRRAKEIADEVGLPETVKMGAMIETPAAALMAEEICKEVDFISYGTNDLTMLVLGVDRGSDQLTGLYNTLHPAVLKLMRYGIRIARKLGVESSICGEAGSDPKMAEILVNYGIDSISANMDAIGRIREVISQARERLNE